MPTPIHQCTALGTNESLIPRYVLSSGLSCINNKQLLSALLHNTRQASHAQSTLVLAAALYSLLAIVAFFTGIYSKPILTHVPNPLHT